MKTLFVCCLLILVAHVFAHMSINFPLPRDKKGGVSYLTWELNEPMVPTPARKQVCHGLDADKTIRAQNVFTAGQTINVKLAGSASHNGGHCAFWYTTNTGGNWKKIIDVKDCTLRQGASVTLPKNIDTACANRCVFAWTWQPLSSGGCEIYSNCADIQVKGGTGGYNGVQISFQNNLINAPCKRVNDATHFGTMFGNLLTSVSGSFAPVLSHAQKCPNPHAPQGSIRQDGQCGTSYPGSRCDDGQCCSSQGKCGPFFANVTADGESLYTVCSDSAHCKSVSHREAEVAFCNNNQGDWISELS